MRTMRFAKLKIKPPKTQIPPILFLAIAGIVGTMVGFRVQKHLTIGMSTTIAITVMFSVLGSCFWSKTRLFAMLFIATAGLFCAKTLFNPYGSHTQPFWVVINDGDLIKVRGVVQTGPTTKKRTHGLLSNIDERAPVTTFELLAHLHQDKKEELGESLLIVEVSGTPDITMGDEITVCGKLRRSLHGNTQNTKLFVPFETLIELNKKNRDSGIEIKKEIKRRIKNGIINREQTLISAVFFGDRGGLWKDLSEIFRRAGLSHILAISGLHVAIIVAIVFMFARVLHVGKIAFLASTLIVLLMLFVIIEGRPPVFRAIVMIGVVSVLQIRGARFGGIGILSMVALVALWIDPRVITKAGFILSFAVVFGLYLLFPTMQWKLVGPLDPLGTIFQTARHKMSSLWVVGFCALLIAAPLTTHIFGTLAPVGFISSVGGVFLLSLVLIMGIVRLSIGWVHPDIDELFRWLLHKTSTITIESAQEYGKIPFGFLNTQHPDILMTLIYMLTLAFFVLKRGRARLKVGISILLIIQIIGNNNAQYVQITTLHVGHGTCHIIRDANATIVVDAGSRSNLDVGLNRVLPTLKKTGARTIDALIVTHNDLDHCSGILDLLNEIPIHEIYMTPYAIRHPTKVINKIIQSAKGKNIPVHKITSGWTMKTSNAAILALWPDQNTSYESSNEASVVVSIQSKGRTILLTGDINEKTIARLLTLNIGRVDVLEMPHHGQWSPEAQSLIYNLKPTALIQSTNKTRFSLDKWTVPHTSNRFVTCIDGDITTTIHKGGELKIETSYTNVTMCN